MQDIRQSPNHASFLSSMGWVVEKKDGVSYFVKRFPLLGSFVKIQRPKNIDIKHIEFVRKKYHAFQIIIEPKLSTVVNSAFHNKLLHYGYKESNSSFLPSKTIFISLIKSEKALLKDLHHKTRYNIKKARDLNIETRNSKDIDMFITLWHKCHKKRLGFLNQKKQMKEMYKAYNKNQDIIFAYKDNVPVAGLYILHYNKVSYYMYAASSSQGKELFAPTLLTWQGMLLAKKRGSVIFDFEGIYDTRNPIASWKGFTKFKQGFGGCEVEFPKCYKKLCLPI